MRRLLLIVAVAALLPGLWKAREVDAGAQDKQQVAPSQSAAAAHPPGYAGAEACETCHADETKKFAENPHSRLALMHGDKGITCENCHGPGQAHIDGGGDVTKIFQFTKATPKAAEEKCLSCHASAHPNFAHSAHGEAQIGCTGCHSIHKAESEESLLKMSQPKLCYGCHTDIKAAFAQPFHHKVDEGLLKCSDCHDPHGTFKGTLQQPSAMLHNGPGGYAVCVKCHSEAAGPFVYPHPVIQTEGCGGCHSPHGSPNPRLLTRNNVNSLCLQCHTASMNFTAPGVPSFHNQANQYQACTVCHSQIHGSNSDPVFFK